jgi:hypothetical protein
MNIQPVTIQNKVFKTLKKPIRVETIKDIEAFKNHLKK